MESFGQTLRSKMGPLPVWGWMLVFVALVGGYLFYKNKKSASTQSQQAQTAQGVQTNLGTVPISNLTTVAQPMPITEGDTFVSVPNTPVNGTTPNDVSSNGTPTSTLQPAAAPPPPPPPAVPQTQSSSS